MTRVLGCDPGLDGALGLYDDVTGALETVMMPTFGASSGKRSIDEDALADIIFDFGADHAYVEKVHAMPKQGVTSSFNFGAGFGIVRGVLAAFRLPRTFVDPGTWKRAMGAPADKKLSRQRASQLFPQSTAQWRLAKEDGRAEAAMLALYGARQIAGNNSRPISVLG